MTDRRGNDSEFSNNDGNITNRRGNDSEFSNNDGNMATISDILHLQRPTTQRQRWI